MAITKISPETFIDEYGVTIVTNTNDNELPAGGNGYVVLKDHFKELGYYPISYSITFDSYTNSNFICGSLFQWASNAASYPAYGFRIHSLYTKTITFTNPVVRVLYAKKESGE